MFLASASFLASFWLAIFRSVHTFSAALSPKPGMCTMGITCSGTEHGCEKTLFAIRAQTARHFADRHSL